MGDFRFRSLLFQFLEALTKPVQPFSLRKRHIRIRPHNCTDSAHGIPKFTSASSLRFEAIYGNIREANRGSAVSTEASLEQAGSKQRETDL
jgi:hypothetical protein